MDQRPKLLSDAFDELDKFVARIKPKIADSSAVRFYKEAKDQSIRGRAFLKSARATDLDQEERGALLDDSSTRFSIATANLKRAISEQPGIRSKQRETLLEDLEVIVNSAPTCRAEAEALGVPPPSSPSFAAGGYREAVKAAVRAKPRIR